MARCGGSCDGKCGRRLGRAEQRLGLLFQADAGQAAGSGLGRQPGQFGGGLLIAEPGRMDVGQAVALGIGPAHPRRPGEVDAQRVGHRQARPLAACGPAAPAAKANSPWFCTP